MQDMSNLHEVAEALGEGWRAEPYDRPEGRDGYLIGPSGETYFADVRAFGDWAKSHAEASLYLKQRVPRVEENTHVQLEGEGHTLADFTAVVKEALPELAEAHRADLARIESLMAPARTFAEEVASYMGEGWAGGAEDTGSDRLQVTAYIEKGALRVQWRPYVDAYNWREGAAYPAAERLSIRGYREHTPHETGFYRNNPHITVAAKRGAKAIAGDITRRLLPGYTTAMNAADEEQARHEEALGDLAVTVEKVRAAMSGVNLTEQLHEEDSESKTLRLYVNLLPDHTNLFGDLCVHPGSVTVDLKAHTMPEEAFAIVLRALADAVAALTPED